MKRPHFISSVEAVGIAYRGNTKEARYARDPAKYRPLLEFPTFRQNDRFAALQIDLVWRCVTSAYRLASFFVCLSLAVCDLVEN